MHRGWACMSDLPGCGQYSSNKLRVAPWPTAQFPHCQPGIFPSTLQRSMADLAHQALLLQSSWPLIPSPCCWRCPPLPNSCSDHCPTCPIYPLLSLVGCCLSTNIVAVGPLSLQSDKWQPIIPNLAIPVILVWLNACPPPPSAHLGLFWKKTNIKYFFLTKHCTRKNSSANYIINASNDSQHDGCHTLGMYYSCGHF